MKKLLLLAVVLCAREAFAAEAFAYLREATLSASTDKLTIQQPASPSRTIRFVSGYVYCSVACTVTLERTGSAASATAATATKPVSGSSVATAIPYVASNSTSGTTLAKYILSAGDTMSLDLRELRLDRTGNSNISFAVSSITGDFKAFVLWYED